MQITYIGHREGCICPALGRGKGNPVAFNETVETDDAALAVGLLAQADNWVAADVDTATFLRDFCDWVEAVQAITPLDPAAPVVDFDTPPATAVEAPARTSSSAPSTPVIPPESKKEREARERTEQEAAAAATNADTSADKDGE